VAFDGGGRCRTTLVAKGSSSDVPMSGKDLIVQGPVDLALYTCERCKEGTNTCADIARQPMDCKGKGSLQPTWTFKGRVHFRFEVWTSQ
jgi:hypothetical protein